MVYAFNGLLGRSFLYRHSLLPPPFHTFLPLSLRSPRTCVGTTPSAFAPPPGPSSSYSPTEKRILTPPSPPSLPPSLPPSFRSPRTCASTTPSAFAPPLGPSSSSSHTGKTS